MACCPLDVDHSEPVKEGPVDPAIAVGTGYGESKWVAERLLEVATQQAGVPTTSVRIGQLSGSESNGAWNHGEWFPSLVKSSLYMKCMPTMEKVCHSNPSLRTRRSHLFPQEISWISVDAAARALVDMADSNAPCFHLVHPRPGVWSSIMEPLAKSLNISVVPYDEWVTRLEKSGEGLNADEEVEMMRLNPALKIIDMFIQGRTTVASSASREAMGLPHLQTTQAEGASPSLALERLPQLAIADGLRWMEYWNRIGYL